MRKEKALYEQFVTHAGFMSWVFRFYKYDGSHLVIADKPFIKLIKSAQAAALSCQFVPPSLAEESVTPKIKKILVLVSSGELALVKKLQSRFPDLIVTSGTYGFSCVGQGRHSTLLPYKPPRKKAITAPIVLITTPYCDGEFVAKSMKENGLPTPFEYFHKQSISWMQIQKDYRLVRFYRHIMDKFGSGEDYAILLQTDFLQTAFEHTGLSKARFVQYLKQIGAKVVFLDQRNTLRQAVVGEIMHNTGERLSYLP